MDDFLRAVVVRPGEPAVVQEIDGSLEGLQTLVGGLIQAIYPFDDRAALVCNDEGKLLGMDLNRALRDESGELYDVIAGPFAVVGLSEDNFTSLTPEQTAHYLEMYKIPERFEHRDGKIVAIPISGVMPIGEFRETLIDNLQKMLERDGMHVTVEPCAVEKIQSGYDGITVREVGNPVGISLDIAPAYENYKRGGLEAALTTVISAVKDAMQRRPDISVAMIGDYSWVMKHISAEVINRELNTAMLEKIPHTEIADLAVVYRIHLFDRLDGAATAVVTNDMLKTWRVSEEQFKADALIASERNYPLQIDTMPNILAGMTGQEMPTSDMTMLVCMAKGIGNYGAGVIAYPDFQEKAREMMGGDFFVLPSSRFEVILVPTSCTDAKSLEELVQSINASDVLNQEDFLSDHVYRFDGETKALELATAPKEHMREPLDVGAKKRGR